MRDIEGDVSCVGVEITAENTESGVETSSISRDSGFGRDQFARYTISPSPPLSLSLPFVVVAVTMRAAATLGHSSSRASGNNER